MKIHLTLDGTPDLLREIFRAIIQEDAQQSEEALRHGGLDYERIIACDTLADLHLERAVKDGHAEILLGEVTESRKLAAAGCL